MKRNQDAAFPAPSGQTRAGSTRNAGYEAPDAAYADVGPMSSVSNPNYDASVNAAGAGYYASADQAAYADVNTGGVSNPNYGVGTPQAYAPGQYMDIAPESPGGGVSNPTYGQMDQMRTVETRSGTIERGVKLVAGDEYKGAALVSDNYLDISSNAANATYSIPMSSHADV